MALLGLSIIGLAALPPLSARAAQVDVTWAGSSSGNYSNAGNWSPQVVPSNGNGGNTYRITIGSPGPSLDIDPAVDTLTVQVSGLFAIAGHTFSSAFTRNNTSGPGLSNGNLTGALTGIRVDGSGSGSKAVLGTLANYDTATGTLASGVYLVSTFKGGPSAVLTFEGARIVTNSAEIYLRGPGIITDQLGNDALQPLAVNNGILHLDQTSIRTLGDFTNNGELDIVPDGPSATALIVGGNLTNFDRTTKTLTGGKYVLWDDTFHGYTTLLQFPGADIVTNAADIFVAAMRDDTVATGRPSIIDENGNDALRNFANNTAGGRISFDDPAFATTARRVTNAGYMFIGRSYTLPVQGVFEQSGGELSLSIGFQAGRLETQGGAIYLNAGWLIGGGTLSGTTFSNAVISPGISSSLQPLMTFAGDVTLGTDSRLRFDVAGVSRAPGLPSRPITPIVSGYDAIDCTGNVVLAGALEINLGTSTQTGSRFTPGASDTFVVVQAQTRLAGSFQNVANGQRLNTADGHGSFQVNYGPGSAFDPKAVVLSGFQPNTQPAVLLNISTRGQIGTGERVMIGGFIVTGSEPKPVLIRGMGPSLRKSGVAGVLDDPVLTLHDGTGATLFSNDDWQQSLQRAAIEASGIAPSDSREAAIAATLAPGSYTAVMEGKNGTIGVGLVEVYDLNAGANSQPGNISTRGFADGGANPLIGGVIIGGGSGSSDIVVRALGPSLSKAGITGAMDNPSVTLMDQNGAAIASNDDWKQAGNQGAIEATGIPPSDDREAALVRTLAPGLYTAVVKPSLAGGSAGVALVEFYRLR